MILASYTTAFKIRFDDGDDENPAWPGLFGIQCCALLQEHKIQLHLSEIQRKYSEIQCICIYMCLSETQINVITSFQHSTKCKTEECLAVQICYINFTAKFFMLHLSAIWSSQVNYSATCNIREKNELQDFD